MNSMVPGTHLGRLLCQQPCFVNYFQGISYFPGKLGQATAYLPVIRVPKPIMWFKKGFHDCVSKECTLKIGPGPDLAGTQGRAKSGRGQVLLDPGKIAGVEKVPSPAKICSTLAFSTDFRPAQNCVGRTRAEIQAWGMGSGRFWLCPQPARPGQNCVGRTKICQATFLPDPQVPKSLQVPPSPGAIWSYFHYPFPY